MAGWLAGWQAYLLVAGNFLNSLFALAASHALLLGQRNSEAKPIGAGIGVKGIKWTVNDNAFPPSQRSSPVVVRSTSGKREPICDNPRGARDGVSVVVCLEGREIET